MIFQLEKKSTNTHESWVEVIFNKMISNLMNIYEIIPVIDYGRRAIN
jgi:hypothetical protein